MENYHFKDHGDGRITVRWTLKEAAVRIKDELN
jgi:hypothetical protein